MYTPSHFDEPRTTALHAFIRRHPLASLVTLTSGRLDANHVPLLLDAAPDPHGQLRGHIARANPLWRDIPAESEVLALFHGADSYITPGWYPSKQQHGRVVPTWNYGVVHVRGRISWHHDKAWLRRLVEDLTTEHEAGGSRPWQVSDAPDDYVEKMLEGIVGLEISIAAIQGKMKLSQNRSMEDRAGVLRGLGESADAGAAEMLRLMNQSSD
jgi:transcriptional regulator